jgi:hypothetical protein
MTELSFLKYKNHPLTDKILLVTATKGSGTNLLLNRPLGFFLEKSGWDARTEIVENNREGLCKVYNRYLTEEYKNKYVIFVHDDVMINDLYFEEKVLSAFEKYDIIGLAGAKSCDLSSEHPAWHTMTKREDMVGEVAHSSQGKTWTTVFGPTDSRALVLDGLFIGVNVNIALEKGLLFDERFDFHHYDITFCLKANELKIKAGVFPLSVIHFGLGDSMNTPEWKESAKKFKEIYR